MSTRTLSILFVALMSTVSLGQLTVGPASTDGINVVYSPNTGDLSVSSTAGNLTTLQIKSDAGNFTALNHSDTLGGLFDVSTDKKIFKLDPAGFDSVSLSGAVKSGLSLADVASDLALDGSLAVGGALTTKPIVLVGIPEPSAIALLFGGIGLVLFRRKR